MAMNRTLEDFYFQTTYRALFKKKFIDFRLDDQKKYRRLDFCNLSIKSWAFISAENPYSIRLSERENYFRSGQLSRYLSVKNRIYVLGLGIPDCVDWPVELGFFILNISMSDAKYIGNKFQQNAILWFRPMTPIKLVWLVESTLSCENI